MGRSGELEILLFLKTGVIWGFSSKAHSLGPDATSLTWETVTKHERKNNNINNDKDDDDDDKYTD